MSRAVAVTYVWDGGDSTNNINAPLNWESDNAPMSDVANTDLLFGGTVRLSPNVDRNFGARSVIFNNNAGAFTIGGANLDVGSGGIVNNSFQMMTFTDSINFGGVPFSEINANNGKLTFTKTVFLPSDGLTVRAVRDVTFFGNLSGDSKVTKLGSGFLIWRPSVPTPFALVIEEGAVATNEDFGTDVFTSSATISINGSANLQLYESATLDGAQLTCVSTADLLMAIGKTLTLQNGARFTKAGAFSFYTGSHLLVANPGSVFSTDTFSLSSGNLTVRLGYGT